MKLELKEKTGIYQRKRSVNISRKAAEMLLKRDLTLLRLSQHPFAQAV